MEHVEMAVASEYLEVVGPYRLKRRLGSGGGGTVMLAERVYSVDGVQQIRLVALKEAKLGDNEAIEQNVENLRREFLVGANIRHPNVCAVLDCVRVEHRLLLELEYIKGLNALELLERLYERGQRLPPEVAVELAMQAAAGLHAIHTASDAEGGMGLVHRDIKPENLMVSEHGIVKVLDLGIVRGRAKVSRHTQAEVVRGTRDHMAPEQHLQGELGPQADVFALGAVLYLLLTGELMFNQGDPRALYEAKARGLGVQLVRSRESDFGLLAEVIARCVQPSPKDRFARAADLEAVLREHLRQYGASPGLSGLMRLVYSGVPLVADNLATAWRTLNAEFCKPRLPVGLEATLKRLEQKGALTPVFTNTTPAQSVHATAPFPSASSVGVSPAARIQPSSTTSVPIRHIGQVPAGAASSAPVHFRSAQHQVATSPTPYDVQRPTPPPTPQPLLDDNNGPLASPPAPTASMGGGRSTWRSHIMGVPRAALWIAGLSVAILGGVLFWGVLELFEGGEPPIPCYADLDGDGFGARTEIEEGGDECGGSGQSKQTGDCDDRDASTYPNAREKVDGVDNDCDGLVSQEEGDDDRDGTRNVEDCAPSNPEIHPTAKDLPGDGVDQDCDGQEICFVDQDGDGWGGEEIHHVDLNCASPGVAPKSGDCDDSRPKTNPSAKEVQNGRDDDCDGSVDEGKQPNSATQIQLPPPPPPPPPHSLVRPSLRGAPHASLSGEKRGKDKPVVFNVGGRILDPDLACSTRMLTWSVPNGRESSVLLTNNEFITTVENVGADVSSVQYSISCVVNGKVTRLQDPSGRSLFTVSR